MFAKPNDPNLTSNGGYDHQADNQYGGNGFDHADSQCGRYGYDHQADNQYDGNGCDHADSQCGRYGYDHQDDVNIMVMDMVKLVVNMVDMDMIIKLTINIVVMNVIIGLMISMVDVGVIKQVMKDMGSIDALVAIKGTICMVMIATHAIFLEKSSEQH